jgi:lipopolysaccharide cholinephosphotransferase
MKYFAFILVTLLMMSCQNDSSHSPRLSDREIPQTDAEMLGKFYNLLKEVDSVLNEQNIPYWAVAGTLLGAERHKGIIPWDDDVDIGFFSEDEAKFLNSIGAFRHRGIEVCQFGGGYKCFYKGDKKIKIPDEDGYYPWRYPFIDLFVMKKEGGRIIYACKNALIAFGEKEYFYPEELQQPFPIATFGPMELPVPHHSKKVLCRAYGDDWNKVGYVEYDHAMEQELEKIVFRIDCPRSPKFLLPTKKSKSVWSFVQTGRSRNRKG